MHECSNIAFFESNLNFYSKFQNYFLLFQEVLQQLLILKLPNIQLICSEPEKGKTHNWKYRFKYTEIIWQIIATRKKKNEPLFHISTLFAVFGLSSTSIKITIGSPRKSNLPSKYHIDMLKELPERTQKWEWGILLWE